mgnify:CR=1 FL=1
MNQNGSNFPAWGIPGIVVGFLVTFPMLWCFVGWLLSKIGGWSRLAKHYPAGDRPVVGQYHRGLRGMVRLTSYKGVLTVHLSDEGLFSIRDATVQVRSPALFIPWSEVASRTPRSILWMNSKKLEIGRPTLATLSLPARVLASTPKSRLLALQRRLRNFPTDPHGRLILHQPCDRLGACHLPPPLLHQTPPPSGSPLNSRVNSPKPAPRPIAWPQARTGGSRDWETTS